jgi:hypothetical protein
MKMNLSDSLLHRIAGGYFKVAVPNPSTHSAKEIRFHQINYLVMTPAEHRLDIWQHELRMPLRLS